MEQFTVEQGIDESRGNHEDLVHRLATLKGEQYKKGGSTFKDDSEESEDEVSKITKKLSEEVALEDKAGGVSGVGNVNVDDGNDDDDEEVKIDPDELPWCVLCNNDATYRCYDCGGDLYCSSCNVEVHKTWGDTDHKVVPYRQKRH